MGRDPSTAGIGTSLTLSKMDSLSLVSLLQAGEVKELQGGEGEQGYGLVAGRRAC